MSLHSYSRCWLPSDLGNVEPRKIAEQKNCGSRLSLPYRIRGNKRCLHEDQLCECRPRSCACRSSNRPFYRGAGAALEGKFISLDQRGRSPAEKICVGKRLWSVLCFRIECRSSRGIYRRSGTTSSLAHVRRRAERVYRATWAALEGGKPLKRLCRQLSGMPPA
jgi:hypothetical protein